MGTVGMEKDAMVRDATACLVGMPVGTALKAGSSTATG